MIMANSKPCWICGAMEHDLLQPSSVNPVSVPSAFAITNADYGRTAAIFRCRVCGFQACLDVGDVLSQYEALEDRDYDAGWEERSAQADDLLDVAAKWKPRGRLLDVGAASGVLVNRAIVRGWDAVGVEPSVWLCKRAVARSLPVAHGVLPHPEIRPPFDVVMLVDVLEHVTDPIALLRQAYDHLAPGGVGLVVTPDVNSIASCLLGRRWWHRRLAHVGYFNKTTLVRTFHEANLVPLAWKRPGWRFRVDYLVPRLHKYLPRFLRFNVPAAIGRIRVPLNLFDSWLVVVTKGNTL